MACIINAVTTLSETRKRFHNDLIFLRDIESDVDSEETMKPLFTIHGGEYLVGSFIEKIFQNINVWLPSKDTGIDLLLTNTNNSKTVSIQVKFSKDYLVTHMGDDFQKGLKSCGWWTINKEKLLHSLADYWVFVLYTFNQRDNQFLIIKPKDLLMKIQNIHGKDTKFQLYFWVTERDKCWESRGLKKKEQILLANHSYNDKKRDFSMYLNNWKDIQKKLN